tara:strand:+ start:1169 stop:1831 length:663 start_codon:yes stop_codon:yes gene_type:complete
MYKISVIISFLIIPIVYGILISYSFIKLMKIPLTFYSFLFIFSLFIFLLWERLNAMNNHFRPNDYTKNNYTKFEKGIYSQYNLFDILNVSQWSIDFFGWYSNGDLNMKENENMAFSHVFFVSKSLFMYPIILLLLIRNYKAAHILLTFMCMSLIIMWIMVYIEFMFDIKNRYIKLLSKNDGKIFKIDLMHWWIQNTFAFSVTLYVLWYSMTCIEKNIDFY